MQTRQKPGLHFLQKKTISALYFTENFCYNLQVTTHP